MPDVRDVVCPLCGVRDIPFAVTETWLWWNDGAPIHPWCDQGYWPVVSRKGKQAVAQMVKKLLREAGC